MAGKNGKGLAQQTQRPVQYWQNRIVSYGTQAANQFLANPLNYRIHPKEQRASLRGVMSEVGQVAPILVNARTGFVVDGHMRVEEALSLDETMELPFVTLDLAPEEEALVLATFDPIGTAAILDKANLDALLRQVTTGDAALQSMLADLAKEAGLDYGGDGKKVRVDPGAQVERAAELQQKWQVKRGQVWEAGIQRLMCGDSTSEADVLRLFDGELADCVFTSPPYGVDLDYGDTYEDTFENLRAMLPVLARLWWQVVRPGGFAVVNFGDIISASGIVGTKGPCEYPMALEYWPAFRAADWVLWSRRVWCKPGAATGSLQCISSNRAATDWEHVWTWRKEGPVLFPKQTTGDYPSQRGWYDTSREERTGLGSDTHNAVMQMYPALYSIATHSLPNGLVYEPFTGTGTTLVAAERLERQGRGMEISPNYCAVTLERLAGLGLEPRLLLEV